MAAQGLWGFCQGEACLGQWPGAEAAHWLWPAWETRAAAQRLASDPGALPLGAWSISAGCTIDCRVFLSFPLSTTHNSTIFPALLSAHPTAVSSWADIEDVAIYERDPWDPIVSP